MNKIAIRYIRLSLIVSFVLTFSKFVAWYYTHSLSIFSDALESIINVIAGAFALYSVILAARPKDSNHPYGHGKVEFFSIGFEGGMVLIAGILIWYKAIEFFINPGHLESLDSGVIIIAITAVVNGVLGKLLERKGKEERSITMEGNGNHLMTDAWSSAALVVALLVIHFTDWFWLDAVVSMVMGTLIVWNGVKMVRRSISGLMDETDQEMLTKVVDILSDNRKMQWIDVHNLRIQNYGSDYHIDCHITLPYYYDLNQVHDEMKDVDTIINSSLDAPVEFFIHTDPCIPECCHYCSVAPCPVRSTAFQQLIPWTPENVQMNQKHALQQSLNR